ncbi:hypothetical protein [Parabacteroides distasonis]|nr:hypothetical protein [Parabacteroides distasonis]
MDIALYGVDQDGAKGGGGGRGAEGGGRDTSPHFLLWCSVMRT